MEKRLVPCVTGVRWRRNGLANNNIQPPVNFGQ